jgi:hypothetical protein
MILTSNRWPPLMNGSPTDDQQPRGEKRAQRRVYVQGRARVLTTPSGSFDAELVDISEGGSV